MNYAFSQESPPQKMNRSTLIIICRILHYVHIWFVEWWCDGEMEIHYVDAVDTWYVWKSSTSKHFFNTLQEVDATQNNHICLGELLAMPTIDANASLFSKDNCSSPCNWTCNFSKRKTERGIYPALPCIAIVNCPQTWRFSGFLRSLMMSIPWCSRHEMTLLPQRSSNFLFHGFFCFVDRV